jgi:hypothetical protein
METMLTLVLVTTKIQAFACSGCLFWDSQSYFNSLDESGC